MRTDLMRTLRFIVVLFVVAALAACADTTGPTTPSLASTTTVTVDTVQHTGEIHPCTGEPLTLTVIEIRTFQTTQTTFRYAYRLLITGQGERGTTYVGQVQQTDVIRTNGESEHLTELLRGSDGSLFSVTVLYSSSGVDFTTFRCLGQ
jgi:hypothetical protein